MRQYIFLLLLCPLSQQAQNLFEADHRISARIGIDPASTISLRYERHLPKSMVDKDIYLWTEFSSALSPAMDFPHDYRLGLRSSIWSYGSFGFLGSLDLSYGYLASQNFDSQKWASELDLAWGLYGSRSYLALTASYEHLWATHLEFSEYYRERFYEAARSGWYKGAGGNLQLGFETGMLLFSRLDLQLEVKLPLSERLSPFRGSPAHLNLGIAYRF